MSHPYSNKMTRVLWDLVVFCAAMWALSFFLPR
jgi:hypothetical protein